MSPENDKASYIHGARTKELPFLMSCASYLLDRRYWITGIRRTWNGPRFDLTVIQPEGRRRKGRMYLVEAKYRSNGRTIRPSEIKKFHERLKKASPTDSGYKGMSIFMTNTRFSQKSLELAKECGMKAVDNVPVLFTLNEEVQGADG